jgi:hypothetical protein
MSNQRKMLISFSADLYLYIQERARREDRPQCELVTDLIRLATQQEEVQGKNASLVAKTVAERIEDIDERLRHVQSIVTRQEAHTRVLPRIHFFIGLVYRMFYQYLARIDLGYVTTARADVAKEIYTKALADTNKDIANEP